MVPHHVVCGECCDGPEGEVEASAEAELLVVEDFGQDDPCEWVDCEREDNNVEEDGQEGGLFPGH